MAVPVLPDGTLILPGLPGNLRVVPNVYDGRPDFPGRWDSWYHETNRYRTELRAALDANPKLWDHEIADIKANGVAYFAAMHLTILEPRTGQRFAKGYHPFIPTPLQVRVMQFLQERRAASARLDAEGNPGYGHGVINKPREVGVTWACAADTIFNVIFEDVWDEIWMSAKEELVDGKGKGTIFGKFDIMLQRLPPQLWPPPGFKPHRHRNHMELHNPANGNQVTGTATTPDATRSERATQFKGDEAAFWPALKEPYVAIVGVTDVAILLSTADEKISHDFQEILDNTRAIHPEAVLDIAYEEHPHFTPSWLERKTETFSVLGSFGTDALKREIHKMGDAGVAKRIYPEAVHVPLTGLPIDPRQLTIMGLDPGRDGTFAIVVFQERGPWLPDRDPPPIDLVWGWMGQDRDARFIASMLVGQPLTGAGGFKYEDQDLAFAAVCARLGRVEYYGDPFGDQRGPNGKTWYTQIDFDAQDIAGVRLYVHTSHKNKDRYIPGRREAAHGLIARLRCLDHPVPKTFLRAFQQYQYGRRSRTRPGVTEMHEAEHDWTSHPTTAMEYVAVHLESRHAIEAAVQGLRPAYASPHGLDAAIDVMKTVPTVPMIQRGW